MGWATYAQPTLNKKYTLGSQNSGIVNIYPTDSCYYAVGSYQNPGGLAHIDPFFLKLDFNGNILIHKTFHLDTTQVGPGYVTNLIETYDNKLVVQYSFDEFIGIVKYDLNGDTLWTRKLTTVYYDKDMFGGRPGGLVENSSDSSLTGVATFHNNILLTDSIGLFNLSKTGELNFIKYYGKVGSEYLNFGLEGFTPLVDGYMISASLQINYAADDEDIRYHPHLIRTDFNGNVITRKTFDENLYELHNRGLIQTEDGGFLYGAVNGYWNDAYNAWDYNNYLVKLDSDLNIDWTKTFGQTAGPTSMAVSRILNSGDGNYLVMGYLWHDTLNSGFLIKFNLNGDFIWDSYFILAPTVAGYSQPRHTLYDAAKTMDGGYIMVGTLYDYYAGAMGDTTHQSWIVKVDSFGCLVPGCQDVLSAEPEAENFSMNLFPNPTTNFINVHYNTNDFSESTTLELYDLQGQHINSWLVTQNNMTSILDVSHLPSGTYILNLLGNGELLKSEKIVIE